MRNPEITFFSAALSLPISGVYRLKLGLPRDTQNTLIEDAMELQNNFKSKNRRTALARLVFRAAIWHIWKKGTPRVFQLLSSHKVALFRRLYEDVYLLVKFCNWPADPSDPILRN